MACFFLVNLFSIWSVFEKRHYHILSRTSFFEQKFDLNQYFYNHRHSWRLFIGKVKEMQNIYKQCWLVIGDWSRITSLRYLFKIIKLPAISREQFWAMLNISLLLKMLVSHWGLKKNHWSEISLQNNVTRWNHQGIILIYVKYSSFCIEFIVHVLYKLLPRKWIISIFYSNEGSWTIIKKSKN